MDEQTNGLMINGDNFHALNLLQSKYREKIKCVYIDPPYNTNSAPILYKDGYKDSSWLCLMEKRLHLSKALSADDGAIFISIDDNEQANLKLLCDDIFGENNFVAELIWKSKSGGANDSRYFAIDHEYIFTYTKDADKLFLNLDTEAATTTSYNRKDERGEYSLERLDKQSIRYSSSLDFEIIAPDGKSYFPKHKNPDKPNATWRWSKQRVQENYSELVFENGNVYTKNYKKVGAIPRSLLIDERFGRTRTGKTDFFALFNGEFFSNPKPEKLIKFLIQVATGADSIVLDYFAGSGTTGHAVINLNREDGGNRKYILVEMGEYFDTVTKPRMQKVIYSADWKNGKPTNRDKGVSQIIKYMRLESYEDALSNIELSDKGSQWASLLGEDYIIRYMLTMESRDNLLNMENFSNPFAYSMKITEKNECKSRSVDLMETFNYLIGLTVTRQSAISYYLSKPATNPAYEGALELVNDINGEYAFRQIEGTLPDGRRALIIWRIVTEDIIASNAALDAYFIANAGNRKHDVIFVNGDSNLENLRGSNENWSVKMTELEFKKRMFEET